MRIRFTCVFPVAMLTTSLAALLDHNSLGLLPLFLAWGATGAQLWRAEPTRALIPAPRET